MERTALRGVRVDRRPGALRGDRTPGILGVNEALFQLSYQRMTLLETATVFVPQAGIEPATSRFSDGCSAN